MRIPHATMHQGTAVPGLHARGWLLAAMALAVVALAPRTGASGESIDNAAATRALQLQVGTAGGYRLDGKPVTRNALEQALRAARGASPELRLRIEASDNVDPQQLIGALALADQAGIRNVGSRVQ